MGAQPTATPDLADWLALCGLKARYCRLLDTKDWAGFVALFTPDFILDASGSGGPRVEGRAAAVARVRESIDPLVTVHHIHAPELAVDVDRAQGIWAMQDRLIWPDGRTLTGYGHYHEDYVRTGAGWKIAASRLTRLGIEMVPPRD